jgi:hypothetical protein
VKLISKEKLRKKQNIREKEIPSVRWNHWRPRSLWSKGFGLPEEETEEPPTGASEELKEGGAQEDISEEGVQRDEAISGTPSNQEKKEVCRGTLAWWETRRKK